MRKIIPVLGMVLGISVFLASCEQENDNDNDDDTTEVKILPVENLQYQVIEDYDMKQGGALHLTWEKPDSSQPDEYSVWVDGVSQVPVKETEDYVFIPCEQIEVFAVYGDEKSDPKALEFDAIESYFELWTIDDTTHPNGFAFTDYGTPVAYSAHNKENWPHFDFYLEYVNGKLVLASPNSFLPAPLNEKDNGISAEDEIYDDIEIVFPVEEGNYLNIQEIRINKCYGLWIDTGNNGYSLDDHFAVVFVDMINPEGNGCKVEMKIKYQMIPGLRWVVTY
jgi:hypothetical protein